MKLAVAIQHHPKRAGIIDPLVQSLQAAEEKLQIIVDVNNQGCWPTYRRCLESLPPWASHLLILQDDVELCRDFLAGAEAAIQAKPDQLLSFFSTRKIVADARDRGGAWAKVCAPLMAQAFCWPRQFVLDFLSWEAAHVIVPAGKRLLDDSRIRMWCLATRKYVWFTAPSLVEHIGYNQSILGHGGSVGGVNRIAKWYIGREQSAAGINWQAGINNPLSSNDGSMQAYADYYKD